MSSLLRERFQEQPFMLAPMAGVTDPAYRIMCRRHGARSAYSEMVSVAGLAFASERTWELLLPAEEEPDLSVQLFGSKPEQFSAVVASIQERLGAKLALIDINMACPARKVITKGEGSALMEAPELAAEIVRACVREAEVPVTVKMRRSFRSGAEVAPELAARLEQAGAAAIAVHGRTASQLYAGTADWGVIDRVASRVSAPVIGSGDVFTPEAASRMLADTAAEAVFIARGSYGNPWIFEDACAITAGGGAAAHGWAERLDALAEHLDLLRATGAHMRRARTFATWYLKGMPHAAGWRGRAVHCETYEDFTELVRGIRADVESVEG